MKLFYTEQDRTLFWIAGYTIDHGRVGTLVQVLTALSQQFTDLTGVDFSEIETFVVNESNKYKHMRVLHATVTPQVARKNIECTVITHTTMKKFLYD